MSEREKRRWIKESDETSSTPVRPDLTPAENDQHTSPSRTTPSTMKPPNDSTPDGRRPSVDTLMAGQEAGHRGKVVASIEVNAINNTSKR